MVSVYGSPDDVFEIQKQLFLLVSVVVAVFGSSTSLASFERKARDLIKQERNYSEYWTTKVFWMFADLFIVFTWYLASRITGYSLNLHIAFYALLVGAIVCGIVWPQLYFNGVGKNSRYWLSLLLMCVGWISALAALVLLLINLFSNFAAMTNLWSGIVAAVFLLIYLAFKLSSFVYYYHLQVELKDIFSVGGLRGKPHRG